MRYFRMRRPPKKKSRKASTVKGIVTLLIIALISVFLVFEFNFSPKINGLAEIKAKELSNVCINEAVEEQLLEKNITYSDLANISYSNDQKIQSITTDTTAMNQLKAGVSLAIQEKMMTSEKRIVTMNWGDLAGINLLKGRGPRINVYINLSSSVNTTVSSAFTSAGINQTLHIITLNISAEIYLTSGNTDEIIKVETNMPIAESIIVGEVPSYMLRAYTE